jgi:taurine transport system permease protein
MKLSSIPIINGHGRDAGASRPNSLSARSIRFASAAAWLVAPFILLIAAWHLYIVHSGIPTRVFPSPAEVLDKCVYLLKSGLLFQDLLASLKRIAIGVGIAVVTGIPFGLLMGSSRIVSTFFGPLLRFSVGISGIAWVPIATLWLGYGQSVCIFVIWNSVFFSIVYSTMLGVRAVNTDLQRAARTLGAGWLRIYLEVLLPGALPAVATGLRSGLGYGWRGLIAAEMIATNVGLGYSLFMAQKNYDTSEIVFIMVLLGVLWLAFDRLILGPVERRTVQRWGLTRGNK